MEEQFLAHNLHLEDAKKFSELDPNLRRLKAMPYVYHYGLIDKLPIDVAGVYTVGGGRQIGKTTLLKQWMLKLLETGVPPQAIAFFSGELIDDHHTLFRMLKNEIDSMPSNTMKYLIIDEVTYIREWDKTIKYIADAGMIEHCVVVLTGSDLVIIKEARMRFPGRRGKSSEIDFHLYPLSFKEVAKLTQRIENLDNIIANPSLCTQDQMDSIYLEFNRYLQHGGYLSAINELAREQKISQATLMIYSDWIRGDMLKRGKQDVYLREILMAIIKRYNSQTTWNSLAHDLSIDHPNTVADYVGQMCSMDALYIQSALLEDKLTAAPKKARKLVFTDPFIFHALRAWLWPTQNPYETQIKAAVDDSVLCSRLVEATVTTHYRRYYPTYYIKAAGEVDVAYVAKNQFWPVEVKWANQLRPKDIKQILKYKNARIFSKAKQFNSIQGIPVQPLPVALLGVGEEEAE